jgi:MFS family permease
MGGMSNDPKGQTRNAVGRALGSSPLRISEFRVLCLATFFTGAGYIGETVILGWLLLERTDSPFVVGLGVALRALPNLLFGLPGGALADRMDRRLLLRLTSAGLAIDTAILSVLALGDQLGVGYILLFTFIGGALRSLGQTARQSYAFDIVGPSQVIGGMALVSLGQRVGGIATSLAVGAVLAQWGAGEAYLAMSFCHLLSAGLILLARTPGQAAPISRPAVWLGVKQYVGELGINSNLRVLVLLTAAVEVLGFSHQAVMPSLARDLLKVGPEGLGLLNAFASFGGMVAIILVSLRGELENKGRFFLGVLLVFGASLVVLGSSPYIAVALIAITVASGLAALSDLLSQGLMQSAVANDLRGRAMGSWMLAIGLGPIGHAQMGALTTVVGVTASLALNGTLLMILAAFVFLTATQIRRL